ncbi:MAG: ABC transporter substrate-binding protein [Anaerolineaceae bacterium]|nr:ABC transporter substrate-binding protein [Anaerolineaceae bacterium]
MNKRIYYIFSLIILSVLSSSCTAKGEPQTLKIGVLPILDTLPAHVALEQGYFEDQGLTVELIPVSSAIERDQLMQAGQLDGMLNEMVSTLFYNQGENQIRIVRYARVASSKAPLFRILASSESNITDAEGLMQVQIGISDGTVIEYVTDRLLEHAGYEIDAIQKISVPKIPDRLALLSSGELDAAVLPDPLSSLAIQQGAVVALDDTSYPEISTSVWSFDLEVLQSRSDTVKAFLIAIEKAVNDINSNKDQWKDLMVEKQLVPPPVLSAYEIPDFPLASVPGENQFQDALQWGLEKELIIQDLQYTDIVDASYLP